ncbi:MAG TPA: UxaA family hydrolase [Dehalococcoidia bacterium]|nr:UxaA family hydrolase [Dehalococcoidia bacterium]
MSVRAIRIDARDNVAVVVADVGAGARVRLDDGSELTATQPVPRGNKIALTAIAAGDVVIRYGEEIGVATSDIAAGEHVHTHNLGGRK